MTKQIELTVEQRRALFRVYSLLLELAEKTEAANQCELGHQTRLADTPPDIKDNTNQEVIILCAEK